jgi:hypothetical protein
MYFTYQLQEKVNGSPATASTPSTGTPPVTGTAPSTGGSYDSILSDLREDTEVRGGSTKMDYQFGGGLDVFDRYFIDTTLIHSSNKAKTQRQLQKMGFAEKSIISSKYW